MKILLLFTIIFTSQIKAFELIKGNYELVSGDEIACEDGLIDIVNEDLAIGTRYKLIKFKAPKYKFSNDDNTCEYNIQNIETPSSLINEMRQVCKQSSLNNIREIKLSYDSNKNMIFEIKNQNHKNTCVLKKYK